MMRLDKFLVHVGIGTRTQVKTMVKQGRVSVNNIIIKKSEIKINAEKDVIKFDNDVLVYSEFVYFMLNKPKGVVSATNDKTQKTVVDLIDTHVKDIFPVGRLDKDTTGLLMLTNDGKLAHELLSPKKHVNKVYIAKVDKQLPAQIIEDFKKGIILDDGYNCLPAFLEILDNTTAQVTIQEGKFHQIKRMFEACDNKVVDLKRVQMGPLKLDEQLKLGEHRQLSIEEVLLLKNATKK